MFFPTLLDLCSGGVGVYVDGKGYKSFLSLKKVKEFFTFIFSSNNENTFNHRKKNNSTKYVFCLGVCDVSFNNNK